MVIEYIMVIYNSFIFLYTFELAAIIMSNVMFPKTYM